MTKKKTDIEWVVVVHAVGGWIALPAIILLGTRMGRYKKNGGIASNPPSSTPFLALGAWILIVGWFGFNVMSAQKLEGISGLVALNSLMAMLGGTITANYKCKNGPGFLHNGPLAGLVAICAGSDIVHSRSFTHWGISRFDLCQHVYLYSKSLKN